MMKKFNKDKYLKKLRFKKYKRYLYIGIPCILVLLLGIYFAYSKFSVFKEEEVVRTTVGDFIQGDIVVGAYIDGEYSKSIPGKNDGYVVDKIVCDNDALASWDNDTWGIVLTNLTKRTKCNVYFKKYSPADKVVAQLDTTGKCPDMNSDGTISLTALATVESTNGYLCKTKDAYGDSYYYRGNVTNNYVKFAGFYWRIVRINGDGSIRVIYDGTSAHVNGEESEDRLTGTSEFNISQADNAYVGYMYGNRDAIVESTEYSSSNNFANTGTFYISKEYMFDENKKMFTLKNPIQVLGSNFTTDYIGYYYASYTPTSLPSSVNTLYKIMDVTAGSSSATIKYGYVSYGTSSKEVAQTNTNDSTIKTYLDNWYKANILGTDNEQYLADNIFCNDRSFSLGNPGTGAGMSKTHYRWGLFADDSISADTIGNYKAMLFCPQQNDAFTVSDTSNGNGALTHPIGLISTDEVTLAGGWQSENKGYYLYSGGFYWTLTPVWFSDADAYGMYVYPNGGAFGYYTMKLSLGVRPVLNLKPEVLKLGTGTMDDPYHL